MEHDIYANAQGSIGQGYRGGKSFKIESTDTKKTINSKVLNIS